MNEFTEGTPIPEPAVEGRLELLQQKQAFASRLGEFAANNPELTSVSNLRILASDAQSGLHFLYKDYAPTGPTAENIKDHGIEFGSRVIPTMLGGEQISLAYQEGNLRAWLRPKGLDVRRSGPREVSWRRGPVLQPGSRFRDDEITPGAAVEIYEFLQTYFAGHAETSGDDLSRKVFRLTAVMAGVLGEEIRNAAVSGKPLDKSVYQGLLQEPLQDLGIELVEIQQ